MKKDVEKVHKTIHNFISQDLIKYWIDQINLQDAYIQELFTLTQSFKGKLSGLKDPLQIFPIHLEFYHKLYDEIQNKKKEGAPLKKIPDLLKLQDSLDLILNKAPLILKKEQNVDRFTIRKNDKWSIRFIKIFKIAAYRVSIIPVKIWNLIRILFKKKPVKIRFWSHKIRYRAFLKYHFENEYLLDLDQYYNSVNRRITSVIDEFWKYLSTVFPDETSFMDQNKKTDAVQIISVADEKVHEIHASFDELTESLSADLDNLLQYRTDIVWKDYELAGTFEFRNKQLKAKYLDKKSRKTIQQWQSDAEGWGNTFYAIFDDWKSDLEIYMLRNKILTETYRLGKMQQSEDYTFIPDLNSLNHVFDEARIHLKEPDENLRKSFVEVRYLINKEIGKKLIPSITEKLGSKNMTGLISKLENDIEESLGILSESHVIVKAENYQRPLKSSELDTISVTDLTSFEMLPRLKNALNNTRNTLFAGLAEINEQIQDLDNIAVFALETAISNIENQQSENVESLKIAMDGIERATMKTGQVGEGISKLYHKSYGDILGSILEFCDKLKGYTDNENILDLKVRIVKSIAIERSKSLRREIADRILLTFKQIWQQLTTMTVSSRDWILRSRKLFLLTAPTPVLSREVSDFLAYSNKKIEGLPVLYKNLYKIHPVKDTSLFVGREQELERLNKAYNNWLEGNYAATVLIGEKWGGSTSLISNFIATAPLKFSLKRIILNDRILDGETMIHAISKEIGAGEILDLDDLIHYLNGLPSKKIIILEDIQKLFLRKVNGFRSLMMLFKLINYTNRNIFWLASCTVYAWNYLKNAISIHDYFSHIIEMKKLSEQEIIEIIKRRNRISGLNIIFEPDPNNKNIRKKMKALSEEEQQTVLQKIYFDDLSDFSESNISLALIFWLLSTREISESSLLIGAFEKPDLSFIKVIGMDRVMTLLALILHDGLNEKEIADVNNITLEQSRMTILMLLEDGVIYREHEQYLVSPLIYRNVIKLLKSKNLLQE